MDRHITKTLKDHRLAIKNIKSRISQSKRKHKMLMHLLRNKYRLLASRFQAGIQANISNPKKKPNEQTHSI